MPSKPLDADRTGITSAHALRLVPVNKPKVLIVEDYDDAREMLRLFLEMKNCCVSEARDGLEAVEMAIQLQPDLILMDGSLPLIDGFEATRRIRKSKRLSKVIIFAMNGWGTQGYHEAALAAGSNCCLEKPINFEKLESFLDPYLSKSWGTVSTGSSKNELAASARSPHLVI